MTTYPDLGSRSAQLHARALRVLPDGLSRTTIAARPYPLYVRSGIGSKITDVDGNELIDFNNKYRAYHGSYDYAEVSLDSASESWGALDQPASVAY